MSHESTETSTEPQGHVVDVFELEVPPEYGGILDPSVHSDEFGNVQSTPADKLKAKIAAEEEERLKSVDREAEWAIPAPYPEDWFRREALGRLIELLPFVPDEMRSSNVQGYLDDADVIARWLRGPVE